MCTGGDLLLLEAAGDQEEDAADALFMQDRGDIGVVLFQSVIEGEQAEIAARAVFAAQEVHGGLDAGHLEWRGELGNLVAEVVQQHALELREGRPRKIPHIVIHDDAKNVVGVHGVLLLFSSADPGRNRTWSSTTDNRRRRRTPALRTA